MLCQGQLTREVQDDDKLPSTVCPPVGRKRRKKQKKDRTEGKNKGRREQKEAKGGVGRIFWLVCLPRREGQEQLDFVVPVASQD